MALFVQKPVFWNTNHYTAPSGGFATSGYPRENGYGHEEWNNSPRLLLRRGEQRYRVFHTEGVGTAPLIEHAGQTFVFMTATHNGIQQLVGIAGNAVGLFDERLQPQRQELVDKLALHDLWEEAWAVTKVRRIHEDDRHHFIRGWKQNLHRIPAWICPEEYFWWFDEPVTLDPRALIGRQKLPDQPGIPTELDLALVGRIMDAVPEAQRGEKWTRLIDAIHCAPTEPLAASDRDALLEGGEPVTDLLTNIQARRGRGKFREDLLQVWGGACAVTGLACTEVLRASHIKPWAEATAAERLDSGNGLLLAANLDVLFYRGLISFDEQGGMLVSHWLSESHRLALGLPQALRVVPGGMLEYLKFHREHVFQH
ncbi:HNH endonuclease [Pseudomonas japonica]|uniref:HNH endonuclease n=1 Tax=Pseudomonas japonica TaxID=256466 RepID=A0A239L2D4_9PSED|nr:HNH endonuclease [Pseudomonas japonica]SNT24621.1 HNH endonuclease [Pseudomonas japonica]